MKRISKLQFITTNAAHAEQACMAGADWIQLRLKDTPYDELKVRAMEVQAVCKEFNAVFIVNDHVTLAYNIGANGVHLGKSDMAPDAARQQLGADFIIGNTANTFEDVAYLAGKPIDYIGLGPFRFTQTKKQLSPILGLEGYQHIFEQLKKRGIKVPPVVGIGGVAHNDVPQLLEAGLYGVAVSGAISGAGDIGSAVRAFKTIISDYNFKMYE